MKPLTAAPRLGRMERLRAFDRESSGGPGRFWGGRVNQPLGMLISFGLMPTAATPNLVSLAGLVVHLVAALALSLSSAPVGLPVWIFMIVAWQLAFSLDCADGQLARARHRASPFGAFFDQMMDVTTHGLLYTALCLYVVRALGLESVPAVLFTALVFGTGYVQLYAAWGRNSILGTEAALRGPRPRWLGLAMHGEVLLDYGTYLIVAGLLLPWPVALAAFLIVIAVSLAVATIAQLGLNWHRHLVDSAARANEEAGQN